MHAHYNIHYGCLFRKISYIFRGWINIAENRNKISVRVSRQDVVVENVLMFCTNKIDDFGRDQAQSRTNCAFE